MFFGVVVSEGRSERGSLSTDVRPFLNHLYHSFIWVMPILSSKKAFCIISIFSVQLLPRLKQNLMQIRWCFLSVIFNCKQMRRTKKARCNCAPVSTRDGCKLDMVATRNGCNLTRSQLDTIATGRGCNSTRLQLDTATTRHGCNWVSTGNLWVLWVSMSIYRCL